MRKIGVLRLSALGDATLVVPLINSLSRSFPDSYIGWITTPAVGDLIGPIKGCSYHFVKKIQGLTSVLENRRVLKPLKFDDLIVAQASFSAHLISMQIAAKRKIGFDRKRGKDFHRFFIDESIQYKDQHFVDAYLAFARKIGASECEASWSGAFSNMDVNWVSQVLPNGFPRVGIATTPSKNERRWAQEGYKEIIGYLLAKNITVCLIGGQCEEEVSYNANIASSFDDKVINLTGKTTLPQLSALLGKIDLLIAPDTGCVHIARALGTPVVGLYAVANPSLTGPYLEQNYCVNKYHDAVSKYLSVSQANDYHQRVHHFEAMSLIKANEVIDKIEQALEALS